MILHPDRAYYCWYTLFLRDFGRLIFWIDQEWWARQLHKVQKWIAIFTAVARRAAVIIMSRSLCMCVSVCQCCHFNLCLNDQAHFAWFTSRGHPAAGVQREQWLPKCAPCAQIRCSHRQQVCQGPVRACQCETQGVPQVGPVEGGGQRQHVAPQWWDEDLPWEDGQQVLQVYFKMISAVKYFWLVTTPPNSSFKTAAGLIFGR